MGRGIFCLARLSGGGSGGVGWAVWVVGECNAGGRQRDERGDQGWQDDGAFHGIPPILQGPLVTRCITQVLTQPDGHRYRGR